MDRNYRKDQLYEKGMQYKNHNSVYLYRPLPRLVYRTIRRKRLCDSVEDAILSTEQAMNGWKKGFEDNGFNVIIDLREHFLVPLNIVRINYNLYRLISAFLRRVPLLKRLDYKLLEKSILKKIMDERIRIFFALDHNSLEPSTIHKINKIGTLTAEWFGIWTHLRDFDSSYVKSIKNYDIIFSCAELSQCLQPYSPKRFKMIPFAYNPLFHKKMYINEEDRKKFGADISFVGSLGKAHSNRIEFLEAITLSNFNLKVWGYGIKDVPTESPLKKVFYGPIWGIDVTKVINGSKINLNMYLDGYDSLSRGINSRTFEIAGCSGFQMAKYTPLIEEFYHIDKEVVCFNTKEELIDKIRFYLKRDDLRKKIASAAYEKTIKYYTYKNRVKEMIQSLCDNII